MQFAERVALSKSVQGLVRALGLFQKKWPGDAIIKISANEEGAVVDFGCDRKHGEAHDSFADLLEKVDRLMQLETAIDYLRGAGAPEAAIDKAVEEAMEIASGLYPEFAQAMNGERE